MKLIKSILLGTVCLYLGCATNPHKAKNIETEIENKEDVGAGETVGTNDKGEMIVQKKVQLATFLRDLQVDVYKMESEIYGDESTGRSGLYGVLRDCRDDVRSKKVGGDGKVAPPPKKDIKTKGEDMSITAIIEKIRPGKLGKDEEKKLVAVTEDYLSDRIKRFEGYKETYQERKEWFQEEIRKCKAEALEKAPAN